MPARPPITSTRTRSTRHNQETAEPSTHLGEERQDGDTGVAAHHGHIHLGHIQAGLLSKEGLGAHLQMREYRAMIRCDGLMKSGAGTRVRAGQGRAGQGRAGPRGSSCRQDAQQGSCIGHARRGTLRHSTQGAAQHDHSARTTSRVVTPSTRFSSYTPTKQQPGKTRGL